MQKPSKNACCALVAVLVSASSLACWPAARHRAVEKKLARIGVIYGHDWFDEFGWANFGKNASFLDAVDILTDSGVPIHAVYLRGRPTSGAELQTLDRLPSVNELGIVDCLIDEGDFELPQITHLSIEGNQISWHVMQGFPKLRSISFDSPRLDEAALGALNSVPSLRHINVYEVQRLDRLAENLLRLRHVKSIQLFGQVDDEQIKDVVLEELRSKFKLRIFQRSHDQD